MDAMDVDPKPAPAAPKPKALPKRPVIKDSDSELSEEDVPLAKRAKPEPPASSPVEEVKPPVAASAPAPAASTSRPSNGTAANSKKRPAADSSDDEKPLSTVVATKKPASSKAKANGSVKPKVEDSDSDAPLSKAASVKKTPAAKGKSAAASSSKTKLESPAKKRLKASTPASSRAASTAADEDGSDDDDDGDGGSDDEEDDEEDEDDEDNEDGESMDKKPKKKTKGGAQSGPKGRGAQKWTTLYHTGPRFPPPYEPVPSDVQLKYDGKPVRLPPESEEAAMFYAVKLETQHARDPVFNKNFFDDYKKLLAKHPPLDGTKITDFDKIDFRPLYEHHRSVKDAEAEAKKQMAPSARKLQLEEKKKIEAEMKTCVVDGVEQKVGNVIVEPPALFLGRGEHPKKGRIKQRISPEQITINHTLKDKNHPPPAPPPGHKWRAVKEDKKSTWLAFWKESINGNYKYMYLDATSNFKSNSDRDKFEKARQLDKCIVQLRAAIDERLTSKQRFERQLGTVVWLIDNYSLRAGNEKGEDEAATYGVCSLLVEHVKELKEGDDGPTSAAHQVKLEFLGKDSMKFKETLTVPPRIFKNFKMFTQSTRQANGEVGVKAPTDEIFDKVDTGSVNKFLQNESNGGMKGLSAKVFRTYNASVTFQGLLDRTEENLEAAGLEPTPTNLKDQYNTANRLVAILCNHQKTVNPVMSEKTQARHEEKMLAIRYDRYKERQKLLTYGKADEIKKNFPVASNPWVKQLKQILEPVDISPEEIVEHEERMIEAKKERLQANFNRAELEREFQREQGEKIDAKDDSYGKFRSQKEVNDEKGVLDIELRELVKERKTNKSRLGAAKINVPNTAKKVLGKITQAEKAEAEHAVKNKTSDVSLGTSKLNYIDPRITVAWLKKWDAKLVERDGEPQKKKPAGKKGAKAKKEESDDEDVKPAKGKKGAAAAKKGKAAAATPVKKGKGKAAAKKEEDEDNDDEDEDEKPKKESEKMELGLKIMPLTQYFPQTMLKKFRWAQYDEDGEDLPAEWVFVEDAHLKVKTNMSSANRKPDDEVEALDEALALEVVAETKVARVQEKNARKSNGSSSKAKKSATKAKKDDSDDSSDDDKPLAVAAKASSSRKSAAAAKKDEDSSDDDAPLARKK